MSLVKSKQRVADHAEVFTPAWMVEAMLDLVKGETERKDSRFLDAACGSGNFIVRILHRKLAVVEIKFGKHKIFEPVKTYPPMMVSDLAPVPGTVEVSFSNPRAAP